MTDFLSRCRDMFMWRWGYFPTPKNSLFSFLAIKWVNSYLCSPNFVGTCDPTFMTEQNHFLGDIGMLGCDMVKNVTFCYKFSYRAQVGSIYMNCLVNRKVWQLYIYYLLNGCVLFQFKVVVANFVTLPIGIIQMYQMLQNYPFLHQKHLEYH